ncbi:serine/arginine-rich SC35-like splicing factor SCL30 isoform X2 [Punica granatum]|uniref:Serine/arginine-rich SC35-like splicing factor SCL30 isoform X2 n=2 Tax=Punica granatum TaxID=22663 RepID=A0A218XRB1_PUNGR|nr:serine/arginine-rich SC35-like splicing factor SCL30 isoform X2 [Punica granatum]OWM87483.1 hypothetical protein CDL15_Pgr022594 [Punica granatum]
MRRYSPPRYSPPRRGYVGYEGRGRSPARRGYGRHRELNHGSLLVRNVPLDCRSEELRVPFERFGPVRDVYLPRDYYSGEPRGFAFIEFVDPHDAADAQYRMNGETFAGRRLTVVVASETRKRPQEMRRKNRGVASHGRRQAYHGHSRSRSVSRSRSPRPPSGSRGRKPSRSYSPAPRRHGDYPVSPNRSRREELSRYPGGPPLDNGKPEGKVEHSRWRSSRSPSGSRSRSADLSPGR